MRLLILGTGGMAAQHAQHFSKIAGVRVVAGVDVDAARLEAFLVLHEIENGFASLEEALAWGKFDAVANVTPDAVHHATTLACLDAGKHVFCEKPLATDYEKAAEMASAAKRARLVGMVNLSYRNVAQIHTARQMVADGALGDIKHFEAAYLQSWLSQPAWGQWSKEEKWLWRLSSAHGSNGVLGDVGIHIIDFAVFAANASIERLNCRLHTFHKAPNDRVGPYVLDANDSFVMSVQLDNEAMGVVHASRWATGHLNALHLRLFGDQGGLEVIHDHMGSQLRACVGDDIVTGEWRDIACTPVRTNYERFAAAVKKGETLEPSFAHAAQLQKVLDQAVAASKSHCEEAL